MLFCRLLERWASGNADPSTPNRRAAALRDAAERVEAALVALDDPLDRYLLELEAGIAEGRSWFGEPSDAELVDWRPVLRNAGRLGLAAPGRRRLPRARRADPRARGPVRRRALAGGPGSRLALGRPLRPAREPVRPRAGRAARPRRVVGRRAHGRRVDQPRPRRPRRAAAAAGRDGRRRDARPLSRRQGSEPGRRGGAAGSGRADGRRGRRRRVRRRGARRAGGGRRRARAGARGGDRASP